MLSAYMAFRTINFLSKYFSTSTVRGVLLGFNKMVVGVLLEGNVRTYKVLPLEFVTSACAAITFWMTRSLVADLRKNCSEFFFFGKNCKRPYQPEEFGLDINVSLTYPWWWTVVMDLCILFWIKNWNISVGADWTFGPKSETMQIVSLWEFRPNRHRTQSKPINSESFWFVFLFKVI